MRYPKGSRKFMARKKPTKRAMRRRLDNTVREYIKLLYGNVCQTCFIHKDSTPLQSIDWSHYISRRYTIIRYDMRNSIPQCRRCHQQYGDGFNRPMIDAINRIWGEGTTDKLELIARQYPSIKGTHLDLVDFRLELEAYYKQLINCLEQGISAQECMESIYSDEGWGITITDDDGEIL